MAGHSKWANIKHRKGAQDAKRGKIFTKLIREITVAVKHGNPDPAFNPRLRAGIAAALAQNMTKETINKAIKRGSGELDGANYEEIRYEGYGPGGVAVIVDTLTDNRQRTVADVRHLLNKNGGSLGTNGSVSFMFDRKGQLTFDGVDENALIEAALEVGAEDVIAEGESFEVLTSAEEIVQVQEALAAKGFATPSSVGIVMRPKSTTHLTDEKLAESMLKLMDALEDNDDVQHVYANFDIPDEVMERLGG